VAQLSQGAEESFFMQDKTHEPGPGRSTSDAAFTELKKEIARRNEQAQKKARELRAVRERERIRKRHEDDL
jgi:hypothetical protein